MSDIEWDNFMGQAQKVPISSLGIKHMVHQAMLLKAIAYIENDELVKALELSDQMLVIEKAIYPHQTHEVGGGRIVFSQNLFADSADQLGIVLSAAREGW